MAKEEQNEGQTTYHIEAHTQLPSGKRVDMLTPSCGGEMIFVGQAMWAPGPGHPGRMISFSITASSIEEAFEHFDEAAKVANKNAIAEFKQAMAQAAKVQQKIIVPEVRPGGPLRRDGGGGGSGILRG